MRGDECAITGKVPPSLLERVTKTILGMDHGLDRTRIGSITVVRDWCVVTQDHFFLFGQIFRTICRDSHVPSPVMDTRDARVRVVITRLDRRRHVVTPPVGIIKRTYLVRIIGLKIASMGLTSGVGGLWSELCEGSTTAPQSMTSAGVSSSRNETCTVWMLSLVSWDEMTLAVALVMRVCLRVRDH